MLAQELRRVFTSFFVERGHKRYPSTGLIPLHPAAPLFTNAGMNQFIPVFLGEEPPPEPPRAMSIQKCVRVMGKHDDIDNVGRSWGHLSFFEMLGNWSFGDYFKEDAIRWAWELVTEGYGIDGDRLWVTVHETDDEAEAIWADAIGIPLARIQRLGDYDNFWEMGETGPCGPDSEIFFDAGDRYGPPSGPGGAGGGDAAFPRYREIWNLVFMQYLRHPDASLTDLPMKNVDTGAGLERTLTVLQGVDSVFDTDELRRLVAAAERATGRRYGEDDEVDVRLRVIADHARNVTFLVSDGVFPSNEARGYVLRRLLRRAVRVAHQLGVENKLVLPEMVAATVEVMGEGYPELAKEEDFVAGVVTREEERFRETLAAGSNLLEAEFAKGVTTLPGELAFKLHDTFGFPIELTREIAAERDVAIDQVGFDAAMEAQRRRAREAQKGAADEAGDVDAYREILDQFGPTEFTGYTETVTEARVLAVREAADGRVEVFLDRTPFYAEGGGQVGDTGTISTDTGTIGVTDTTAAVPSLHRHVGTVVDGTIVPGQTARAAIDVARRDAIRRNHTGTHLLHWALREVLGPHVKQQGSLVHPDYLRFDFSHHAATTPEELARIEALVNDRVLADEPVRAYETTKAQADAMGAISFFDEKYGDYVRIVEAGDRSMELCGGTHVPALGFIGPLKITSEGSVAANMRRIFATTGTGTLERMRDQESLLVRTAELLRSQPQELPEAVERLQQQLKAANEELKRLRAAAAQADAGDLLAEAVDGIVVARRDGLDADQLRGLATSLRDRDGVQAAVLIGSPDGERVALVAAVAKHSDLDPRDAIGEAAKIVGGGGKGRDPKLVQAGGRDVGKIEDALAHVRAALSRG